MAKNFELDVSLIKEERIKNGVSQVELSTAVDIKTSNLSAYENKRENIPIVKLNEICNYLKLSFDYVLKLTDKNDYKPVRKEFDLKIIGERLKSLRKKYNLYQETLAMEIGTSKSLICEYEKGKKLISLPYAYAICKKYNVSMDYLYGKIDS